jgi:hypothetical protein
MQPIIVDIRPQSPSEKQEAKKASYFVMFQANKPNSCEGSTLTKALGCLLLAALFAVRMYRDASQPVLKILMNGAPSTLFRCMLPIRGVLLACWFTNASIQFAAGSVKSCTNLQRIRIIMDIFTIFLLLVSS